VLLLWRFIYVGILPPACWRALHTLFLFLLMSFCAYLCPQSTIAFSSSDKLGMLAKALPLVTGGRGCGAMCAGGLLCMSQSMSCNRTWLDCLAGCDTPCARSLLAASGT